MNFMEGIVALAAIVAVFGWVWYGLFVILIPVYAFLLMPIRAAAAGDTERFLERTATIKRAP